MGQGLSPKGGKVGVLGLIWERMDSYTFLGDPVISDPNMVDGKGIGLADSQHTVVKVLKKGERLSRIDGMPLRADVCRYKLLLKRASLCNPAIGQ